MTDTHTVTEPASGFKTECHLCDWQSKIWVGPDGAQGARYDHIQAEHPDASINWWADAPAVEIVENSDE